MSSKQREKKEKIVAEFAEKVGKAKALVFTNYQGMTHKQLEELKKALKALNAELAVTKNTLLKRALEIGNLPARGWSAFGGKLDLPAGEAGIGNSFEGPTATLFSYGDPVAAIKELAKSIKALTPSRIKFAIFEGKIIAEQDIIRISTLPSREVLIAQVVGGMKTPLFGLHRALSWNLQKFVLTLRAVEQRKG